MRTRLAVTALSLLLYGQWLHAQPNQDGGPPNGPGFPRDRITQALDTDRDGELSETEIRNAPEVLKTLDRNKDGSLTFDEFLPDFPGPRGGFGGRPGRGMGPNRPKLELADKHDKDGNGYLDSTERKSAIEELKTLNANNRRGPRGPRGRTGEPGQPGPKVSPDQVKVYPDRTLYDPEILRTVFIQFDTDSWEEEMAAFKNTDVEMPATVIVDGKTYPLVGLKFRGQSSFFMVPAGSKRSLNLSMDFIDSDQRLYGYRTLNLLNCNGDSSMMSSALYSFVAQDLLPVPKANFVKVVINGESWGVYANLQQFNKDFLRDHYKSTSGVRWKVPGNPGADGGLRYLGDDLESYKQRFEIKSKDKEKSWRALINLCKVLNETPSEELPTAIEPMLDVDSLLRFLAIDVAVVNSDGYWTRASDYNLYLDPTGMFHVIPHDMNEAFVTSRGPGGPFGGGRPGGERPGGFGPPPGFERGRPASDDDRSGEFEPRRREGPRDGGFRRGGFGGGRRGGPGGPGHGDATLDPLVGIDSERMPLRSKILAVPAYRQKYLQYIRTIAENKLDLKTIGPVIQRYRKLILEEVKADTRSRSSFDAFASMTSETSNDDAPQGRNLYTFLKERRAFLLAHDEIKRVESIRILPQKSHAPIVTTVGPTPSILISELLASNKKGSRDPQGQLEDWIELVNYGDAPVDLSGMFLSDKPTNLYKWRIPDGTVLKAGQYLVIWADEDEGDAGLHANFKLSAKGESVTLVSGDTMVDKVEFGAQKPDVSFGRIDGSPDSGQQLTPTPGEPNQRLK